MTRCIASVVILMTVAVATGCDSNDNSTTSIARVEMSPDSLELSEGETADFDLRLLNAEGDIIQDPGADVRWWSTDTTVFTVDENGLAVAQGEGEATCMAEVSARRFTGRDSAFVGVSLF